MVCYRSFGTTYRSHLQGSSSVEDWTVACPETSVTNYHSTLRKVPEELRSHLQRSGSLKSHTSARVAGLQDETWTQDLLIRKPDTVRSNVLFGIRGIELDMTYWLRSRDVRVRVPAYVEYLPWNFFLQEQNTPGIKQLIQQLEWKFQSANKVPS